MPTQPPRRRGLPGPLLALLYVVAVVLPIGLAALQPQPPLGAWVRAASASGLAAGVMVLLQMITSGRFEGLSGRIGIDVTMGFHKWAAPVALALAIAHPLFYLGLPDPRRPNRFDHHLDALLGAPHLWDGRIALILLMVLVVLALVRDRLPLRYEGWRATHAAGAFALIALVVWHALSDGRYSWHGPLAWFWVLLGLGVAGSALTVYLRRLGAGPAHDWRVASCRKVADRLWEVALEGAPGNHLRFRAGQFAWLATGGHRLPLFDHPFSIASPPAEGDRPRFLIREAGDFTTATGALKPGAKVTLDAPHGSFTLDEGGTGVLLIAGGVGIAPILSVLTEMAARDDTRTVRLIYSAHDAAAMVPEDMWRPALDRLGGKAVLIASVPGATPGIRRGRLGAEHLQAALEGLDPARTKVMICGPGPLMTDTTDRLNQMGVPLSAISYERFSYDAASLSGKDRRALTGFLLAWGAIGAAIAAFALAAG